MAGQFRRIDIRRTDDFERPRRSPPLRYLRPFEMHCARKDRRAVERGHVWCRHDPSGVGLVEPEAARPTLHRHDFEFTPDTPTLVEHPAQLSRSHPVPRRQRELTYERLETRFENVPLDRQPVYRVRSVTNDDLLAQFFSRTHTIGDSVHERVYATADIL